MKVNPHLMLEVIWKDNSESFVNSEIVPKMMEMGEIIGITGKYEFYSQDIMNEIKNNVLENEHGINLSKG